MAKKKTIDLRSLEPTPVPAGDVNIIYNGTRIGGFSEDTEATLKTGGTRVLHDINVNYTKPETGPALTQFSMTYTGSGVFPTDNGVTGALIKKDAANNLITADIQEAQFFIPDWDDRGNQYSYGVYIAANSDIYNVTMNDEPVLYNETNNWYPAFVFSPTLISEIVITIADKQV